MVTRLSLSGPCLPLRASVSPCASQAGAGDAFSPGPVAWSWLSGKAPPSLKGHGPEGKRSTLSVCLRERVWTVRIWGACGAVTLDEELRVGPRSVQGTPSR